MASQSFGPGPKIIYSQLMGAVLDLLEIKNNNHRAYEPHANCSTAPSCVTMGKESTDDADGMPSDPGSRVEAGALAQALWGKGIKRTENNKIRIRKERES